MFSFVAWAESVCWSAGVLVVLLCAWHPASITMNILIIRWMWFDFMWVLIFSKIMVAIYMSMDFTTFVVIVLQ